jgi:hypothetical protein
MQPLAHRRLSQRHVVLLGAGEVLQQIAELIGSDDAQVHLQPGVGAQPNARGTRVLRRLDEVERRRRRGQGQRIGCGGDDVQVLDAVGHAPGRAGQLDALRGRVGAHSREQLLANRQRAVEDDAPAGAVAGSFLCAPGGDGGQDALLGLGSKALERPDLMGGGGRLERLQRVHRQLLEEPPRPFGAEPRQAGDLEQARGELGAELDRSRDLAIVGEGEHLLLDDRADAGQLSRPTFACQRGHGDRRVADRLGGVAVGDDPVDDRPVELVEIAEFIQRDCDLCVRGVSHIH